MNEVDPAGNIRTFNSKRFSSFTATNNQTIKSAASKVDVHPLKRYRMFKSKSIDKGDSLETNTKFEVGKHRKSSSHFTTDLQKKPIGQIKVVPED